VTAVPKRPKVYHITHVDNLPLIVADGGLVCDRTILERGGPARAIGMSSIKERRVRELTVRTHPDTRVGDYVPFYFCPRSVMLYVIFRGNHPELQYRGGQGPVLHLEADLFTVVDWAEASGRRWAFSLTNAGARLAEFRSSLGALRELNWKAIASTDFRDGDVKEGKQAEFLVHESFPLGLVERIGILSKEMRARVVAALADGPAMPRVEVRPEWYYLG